MIGVKSSVLARYYDKLKEEARGELRNGPITEVSNFLVN